MPSDIQIFVKFQESTVFAGETVNCLITFRNITNLEPEIASPAQWTISRTRKISTSTDKQTFPGSPKSPLRRSSPLVPTARPQYHKSSQSLGLITPRSNGDASPQNSDSPRAGHSHKRSVSIISIGTGESAPPTADLVKQRPSRPGRGHGRSASLQVLSGWHDTATSKSPNIGVRGDYPRHVPDFPDSNTRAHASREAEANLGLMTPRSLPTDAPLSPPDRHSKAGHRTKPQITAFKFPLSPASNRSLYTNTLVNSQTATNTKNDGSAENGSIGHLAPVARIISGSSIQGSARSSTEIYAMSNQSSDTIASEYVSYGPRLQPVGARHSRHFSSVDGRSNLNGAQVLLMGYAQITASFQLDGSLVNQSSFEEVKRKGVLGGQGGGGVVGVERPRSNTFLGSLGWTGLGDSLNGLLNGGEMSSIKEMRGTAASKSIPLLSTPQSLLFVDLRLAPGEERSFSFSFTLPKGLPASHRGKAMKVVYDLVIGTQRAGVGKGSQQVKKVSVPFRVFSGVDTFGDILGHDLMRPHILLSDKAKVQTVPPGHDPFKIFGEVRSCSRSSDSIAAAEFLAFVDHVCVEAPRRKSSQSFLSPSRSGTLQMGSISADDMNCKDIIDLAILRSNQATSGNRSTNRFEIARNGRAIAVVVLNRPSHRLGETITATIDFSKSDLPCYSLRASLESAEKINPAIALRSAASIDRATRRIHASLSEAALYASRIVFNAAIPISASPTILTSGVSLEWNLRFEFATSKAELYENIPTEGLSRLLDSLHDERGNIQMAKEELSCETFEVVLPLTVYGEATKDASSDEAHCLLI